MTKNCVILLLSTLWIILAVCFYYDGYADGRKKGQIETHARWQDAGANTPHIYTDPKNYNYFVYRLQATDNRKISEFIKKQTLGGQKDE